MTTFPNRFGARATAAFALRTRLAAMTAPTSLTFALTLALTFIAATLPAHAADETAALRAAVRAEGMRPRAPVFDRKQFLSRPAIQAVALSPDGRGVAYLREQGRNRGVWWLPTRGGAPRRLLANTTAQQLSWSRDARWLFLETPRQLFALAVGGNGVGSGSAGIPRENVGNASGAVTRLGGDSRRELLAVDPTQPAAVVVLERPPTRTAGRRIWRLYRIDAQGRQRLLREDPREIVHFALAPDGRLAFLLHAQGEGHVLHRVDARGRLRPAARCVRLERCILLPAVTRGGDVQMQSEIGGNFRRLMRVDAANALHTLHMDPRQEADLEGVATDPATGQPMIATYCSTVGAQYGLSPQVQRHVAAITQRLPRRCLRIEVGHGPGANWLVRERADVLRGERRYLYDPAKQSVREILADAEAFHFGAQTVARPNQSAMARQIPFAYPASDGMRLHGFLWVPPGVDAATAPMMVSVHGGPFNLVRPGFSNDGQFLANRGFVVFQPNFRGSTGHGRAYMLAAKGDFGNGRVQRDIVEGVRFLLAQGIGDPQRVGITGASFGGYSTLLGVTFQPELFKLGIAAVPPADFGWTLRDYAGAGAQMVPGVPMAASMRHLSLDPADPHIARRLTAQSPIAHAATLRRPLLMLAGGEDERVPIRQVTHYAAALRALDKDASVFIDAQAGHGIDNLRSREAYYFLTEYLLHRELGGPRPRPPSTELREHLRDNLRLRGRSLAGAEWAAPERPGASASRAF